MLCRRQWTRSLLNLCRLRPSSGVVYCTRSLDSACLLQWQQLCGDFDLSETTFTCVYMPADLCLGNEHRDESHCGKMLCHLFFFWLLVLFAGQSVISYLALCVLLVLFVRFINVIVAFSLHCSSVVYCAVHCVCIMQL